MRVLPIFGASLFWISLFNGQTASATGQALQIIVSKDQQQVTVYRGTEIVAQSNVSTGKPGHTTPSGIFSILEKRRHHRSNIYSNAPMPWMQRITWSGVALHESSHVPSHPASHGCVRLPAAFAAELFQMTERGGHVIISDEPVSPVKLSGSALFTPRLDQPQPTLSDAPLRASLGSKAGETVEIALNEPRNTPLDESKSAPVGPQDPIYVMITRTTAQHKTTDVQARLNALGFEAGEVDGILGPKTRRAIRAFQADWLLSADGEMDDEFLKYLDLSDNKGLPPNGWLMIRRNFKEIYSAGVVIDDPETALGTHFLEALNVSAQNGEAEWYGVSLNNHLTKQEAERLQVTNLADNSAFNRATKALERIDMSDETRRQIETNLTEGSAITITDTGYQRETGLGTNFVTLTRRAPAG